MRTKSAAVILLGVVLVAAVMVAAVALVPRLYGEIQQKPTVTDVFTAASAVISGFGFVAVVMTIVVQGQQLKSTSELTTTAILFEYYNDKIGSLRRAIGEGRNVRENEQKVEQLLKKHGHLLERLEEQYPWA